jgi:hypothetical protein
MFNIVKETIASVKDNSYGSVIISRSVGQAVWYWTRYILFFAVVFFLIAMAALTYSLPQLPRAIRDNFPNEEISIKDGNLSTSSPKPLVWSIPDFAVIIDPQGKISDLDPLKSGVLLQGSQAVYKDDTGQITTQSFKNIPNFSVSRDLAVSWISTHQGQILAALAFVLLLISLFIVSVYWLLHASLYLFLAFLLWLLARLRQRPLLFVDAVKLILYAVIVPLWMSVILSFGSNPFLSLISFLVLVFFAVTWWWNLPRPESIIKSAPTRLSKKRST